MPSYWPISATLSPGTGLPSGVTGDVQFNNAGAFAGSNNLFWDITNSRLGIGTTSPSSTLSVFNAGATAVSGIFGNSSCAVALLSYSNVAAIQGYNSIVPASNASLVLQPQGNYVGIGTASPTVSGTGKIHCSGDTARITDTSRTPANSAAPGNDGEICFDSGFVYVHSGGSWRRAALSTF